MLRGITGLHLKTLKARGIPRGQYSELEKRDLYE